MIEVIVYTPITFKIFDEGQRIINISHKNVKLGIFPIKLNQLRKQDARLE
jgi:hypothetical protein